MRKFYEAFVYFVENGIDPKTAKEFAEKVTGIKAPEGKIEIPKTKSPDEFQMPKSQKTMLSKLVITCLVIMQRVIQNTTQMF